MANQVDFPDYSIDELLAIALLMLERLIYDFTPGAERAFVEYLDLRMKQPQFPTRSVRKALDRARMRRATRLFEVDGVVTRESHEDIEADDIRNGRVFDLQAP